MASRGGSEPLVTADLLLCVTLPSTKSSYRGLRVRSDKAFVEVETCLVATVTGGSRGTYLVPMP